MDENTEVHADQFVEEDSIHPFKFKNNELSDDTELECKYKGQEIRKSYDTGNDGAKIVNNPHYSVYEDSELIWGWPRETYSCFEGIDQCKAL